MPRHAATSILAATLALAALPNAVRAAPASADVLRIVEGHVPPEAGEHPRLMVRKGDGVEALRRAAATDWGRRVTARLHQALKLVEKLAITGRNREVIKEAGFKAAGYGAACLLDQDARTAAEARDTVLKEVVHYPLTGTLSLMDRISRLHGTAVAYDLCYDAWDEPTRAKVRAWLAEEARDLRRRVDSPEPARVGQPERVTAHAVAGIAELALLGDSGDAADPGRIADSERAVLAYLDRHVGPLGFDAHGESVREAAFASGILEFLRAERLVLGRDLTGHPAVAAVLVPMVYMTVPEVGIAVTGGTTATVDRTGLFALATDLTPPPRRPAVAWLFEKVGGEQYLGIVRPHHGLAMMTSGLDTIEPVPPGDPWPRRGNGRTWAEHAAPGSGLAARAMGWPRFVHSDRAGMAVFRSRWKDAGDVATVVHDGALRILGPASPWAAQPGVDAARWSHDPGAGGLDNVFLFSPNVGKQRVYELRLRRRLVSCRIIEPGRLATLVSTVQGRIDASTDSYQVSKRKGGKKVEEKVPVPAGGPFEGTRVLGIDYTGRCGTPGLFVIADRLSGGGEVPRTWALHTGPEVKIATDGPTFSFTDETGAGLHATVVYPPDVTFEKTNNRGVANFVTARTPGDRFEVVMTVRAGGPPPKVSAGDEGLAGDVRVGQRTVRVEADAVVFD